MTELALTILDLCENAVRAGAEHLFLEIVRKGGVIRFVIEDDGCGMDEETLQKCTLPFFTTRITRRMGLGLPLAKACAENCGGGLEIDSQIGRGTRLRVHMRYDAFDCPPMGDLTGAVQTLFMTDKPKTRFRYEGARGRIELDAEELEKLLGGVPLRHPAVWQWIGEYISEEIKRADGAEALSAGEIYFGGAHTMKSVAELEAIRLATLGQVNLRREHADASHVVVSMGTCGIAAGAKDVVKAFMSEAGERGLLNMTVSQTGCMGYCAMEPVVEVSCPGTEKVLYTRVTPEMVKRIVEEHIVGGKIVVEYM